MIEIQRSKTLVDRLLLAGVALLMALALVLPMLSTKQAHAAVDTWTQHPGANKWGTNSVFGVAAIADNDVWTVGEAGNVWHYDGVSWTQHSGSGRWGTQTLIGISAVATNDVWLNGGGGHVWHYNGSTWTQHSGTGKWNTSNSGYIYARAANDVWLAGGNGNVWHYDGTTWTEHLAAGKWGAIQILRFDSTAANNVWLVGDSGNVWQYDGTDWTQHSGAGLWANANMQSVSARAANDVWVTGFGGHVWHYNGSTWTQHDGTGKWGNVNVRDVNALAANNVWISTFGQGTWRYDGTDWTRATNGFAGINTAIAFDLDLTNARSMWLGTTNGGVWNGTDSSPPPIGFTNPTNKEVMTENTRAVTDLQLTGGSASDVVNVNLAVDDGSLAFGSSTGLTFTGATSGDSLQFSGTKIDINAALATLIYTAPNTIGTYKFDALINEGDGTVFWSGNDHAYKVVTPGAGISWTDAKTAAESQTFGGVPGYLATITSQTEHDFILTRIDQSGWIGANDIATEGEWRWATGPETGLQFWQGDAATGHAIGGTHNNWGANEPNNGGGTGEDCAQIRFTPTIFGSWNDLDCSTLLPNYVVEFGAPGALPEVVTTSFNFNVVPVTYTLSFDAQGGTDVDAITGVEAAETVTLPAAPVKSGYIFDDWNTAANGSGTAYQPGNNYTMPASATTLYAQWTQDGNVNSIPDGDEDGVYNFVDPATGHDITIVLDESCDLLESSMTKATNHATKDSGYTYPTGFVNFAAEGCDGDQTEVELYYHRTANNSLVLRKYNPNTREYFTVADVDTNASLTSQTIGGQNLVIAKFTVADGGRLDVDGKKDGTITDPVGLGILATINDGELANTGDPIQIAATAGTILALAGMGGLLLYRKRALTRP